MIYFKSLTLNYPRFIKNKTWIPIPQYNINSPVFFCLFIIHSFDTLPSFWLFWRSQLTVIWHRVVAQIFFDISEEPVLSIIKTGDSFTLIVRAACLLNLHIRQHGVQWHLIELLNYSLLYSLFVHLRNNYVIYSYRRH